MGIGDIVTFKFQYETKPDVFIYPGEIGLIKSKALWYVTVLHFKSGREIFLKEDEIEIMEDK